MIGNGVHTAMATKDEILFTLENAPEDKDYEDVYRIHQEVERKDRKIALIFCAVLAVVCIVLLVVLRNISFLFYAVACVIIGVAYIKVPSNRKFIATTRLLIGEKQLISFAEHEIRIEEQYDSDEAFGEAVDEEENEGSAVVLKTSNMAVYENARGFLFADGKITNLFLYVPKRNLTELQIEQLQQFADERCSKGHILLEMEHIVDTDDEVLLESATDSHDDEREKYYGYYSRKRQFTIDDDADDDYIEACAAAEDAALSDHDNGCDCDDHDDHNDCDDDCDCCEGDFVCGCDDDFD